MAALRIHRISQLSCPHCKAEIDSSRQKPMTELMCENCGTKVCVPGVFDNYLLHARILKEPLCALYSAFDNTLERGVAIRIINPEGDKKVLKVMIQTAQRIANINHPNVARVHRVDSFDESTYVEEELLLGGSLQQLIDSKELVGELEALDIMRDVAMGLDAAHQVGIYHLNIAPEHICFDEQGTPKISHFAHHRLEESKRKLIGLPDYVSPEAALFATGSEHPPGIPADVYSLGACFYHLLAGQPPFEGESVMKLIKSRFKVDPHDLDRVRPVSRQTSDLLADMLALKIQYRPQDMMAVVMRLDEIIDALIESGQYGEPADSMDRFQSQENLYHHTLSAPEHDMTSRDKTRQQPIGYENTDFDPGERTVSVAMASISSNAATEESKQILAMLEAAKLEALSIAEMANVDEEMESPEYLDSNDSYVIPDNILNDVEHAHHDPAHSKHPDHSSSNPGATVSTQSTGAHQEEIKSGYSGKMVLLVVMINLFFIGLALTYRFSLTPSASSSNNEKPETVEKPDQFSHPQASQKPEVTWMHRVAAHDTYILRNKNSRHGNDPTLLLKEENGLGNDRIIYLRFNISGIDKKRVGHVDLRLLLLKSGLERFHEIYFAIIKDGPDELIDEKKFDRWSPLVNIKENIPIQKSKLMGNKEAGSTKISSQNAGKIIRFTSPLFLRALSQDTNGVLTLALFRRRNHGRPCIFASKESKLNKPPTLHFRLKDD